MKTVSTQLGTHLNREVTTLCVCWRIERSDGQVFAFTSHDMPLTIGGIEYECDHGFTSTAMATNSDLSVDNLDIAGVLTSDSITNEDLRNKLFDYATFYIFVTNWQDPRPDDMKMRRGTFGEVVLTQNGMFTTEVRGMMQALSHNYIEVFQPECRTDFCSAKCKLNINDFSQVATVFSAASGARQSFVTSALPDVTLPTSVGAYSKWRLLITGSTVPGQGFGEFVCFDQDGALITGGTATASSSTDKYESLDGSVKYKPKPSKMRDHDDLRGWLSKIQTDSSGTVTVENSLNEWWQIEFSSPKDISEWMISRPTDYLQAPTDFTLQYWDGALWVDAKECTAGWSNSIYGVWAFGQAGSEPYTRLDDATDIAPPFEAMSTYVGGSVTWLTGGNRGRVMEISAFDTGTQTVTLFDAMGYEIHPGDTFKIAQGCDKRFATCKLYENVVNFRGEPDVPGQDAFLTYPDAS